MIDVMNGTILLNFWNLTESIIDSPIAISNWHRTLIMSAYHPMMLTSIINCRRWYTACSLLTHVQMRGDLCGCIVDRHNTDLRSVYDPAQYIKYYNKNKKAPIITREFKKLLKISSCRAVISHKMNRKAWLEKHGSHYTSIVSRPKNKLGWEKDENIQLYPSKNEKNENRLNIGIPFA